MLTCNVFTMFQWLNNPVYITLLLRVLRVYSRKYAIEFAFILFGHGTYYKINYRFATLKILYGNICESMRKTASSADKSNQPSIRAIPSRSTEEGGMRESLTGSQCQPVAAVIL